MQSCSALTFCPSLIPTRIFTPQDPQPEVSLLPYQCLLITPSLCPATEILGLKNLIESSFLITHTFLPRIWKVLDPLNSKSPLLVHFFRHFSYSDIPVIGVNCVFFLIGKSWRLVALSYTSSYSLPTWNRVCV